MSLAFTFTASTSFFTLDTSPFRQASNSSLKAPFAPPPPPLLPLLLQLPLLPGLPLSDSGVEPGLVPLPSVVVGELALLLVLLVVLLLLLLAVRARAGEVVVEVVVVVVLLVVMVGEAGATSPSAAFSIAPLWGSGVASSVGAGGEAGGVPGREDSREFGCCCCWELRRGVAIFTTVPTSNKNTADNFLSRRAKLPPRFSGITFTFYI